MYKVIFTRSAVKDLASLDTDTQKRITLKIRLISHDPRGPGSLKMTALDVYRARVGDYRIMYTIDDAEHIVTINRIGHRREVYR